MKYITPEVFNCDDEDWSTMKAAFDDYRQRLDELSGSLTPEVMELARSGFMDDALIVSVTENKSDNSLQIVLRCGDLQVGDYDLVLQYLGFEMSLEDRGTLNLIRTSTSNEGWDHDGYCDEFDVLPDTRIEHRLLFCDYRSQTKIECLWFAIKCRDLQWKRVERPDRVLPN